jgi:hypothetical protein
MYVPSGLVVPHAAPSIFDGHAPSARGPWKGRLTVDEEGRDGIVHMPTEATRSLEVGSADAFPTVASCARHADSPPH